MNFLPIFLDKQNLPKRVGHLVLGDIEVYEQRELGVKLRYHAASGTKADIYLYNAGRSSLPGDIRSPEMLELFRAAYSEIRAAADLGFYENLEVMNSEYLHVPHNAPEPLWLWAAFRYRQTPQRGVVYTLDQVSHLTLRTDEGYIHKVRYTYPGSLEAQEFSRWLEFLVVWQNALRHVRARVPQQFSAPHRQHFVQAASHDHLPRIPGSEQPLPPEFFHLHALMEKERQAAQEALGEEVVSAANPAPGRNSEMYVSEGLYHEMTHAIYHILEDEMALSIDIAGFPRRIDGRPKHKEKK